MNRFNDMILLDVLINKRKKDKYGHAHWKADWNNLYHFKCSKCGFAIDILSGDRCKQYCPGCNSKMFN